MIEKHLKPLNLNIGKLITNERILCDPVQDAVGCVTDCDCTFCDSYIHSCDYDGCTIDGCAPTDKPCARRDHCVIDYSPCAQGAHDDCIYDHECGQLDTVDQPCPPVG